MEFGACQWRNNRSRREKCMYYNDSLFVLSLMQKDKLLHGWAGTRMWLNHKPVDSPASRKRPAQSSSLGISVCVKYRWYLVGSDTWSAQRETLSGWPRWDLLSHAKKNKTLDITDENCERGCYLCWAQRILAGFTLDAQSCNKVQFGSLAVNKRLPVSAWSNINSI